MPAAGWPPLAPQSSVRWNDLPKVRMPSGDVMPVDWALDLEWARLELVRLIEKYGG